MTHPPNAHLELSLVSHQPVHSPGADTIALALALTRQAPPRCGSVRVVAIDGPSGSGKTTLAAALAQALDAPTVHMDDLFPGWDGLAAAPALLTTQVLEPLARGERAAYRRWDWIASAWGDVVPVPATDVLVVEGCGASVGPAARYAAVRIWVEAELDVRMARGIARDGEMYRPHWQRWADQEVTVFGSDHTRTRADIVLDTTHVP
ncbi:MAG TPA: (d)CMP kinase [Dermatophilaceae bacterium]|nr:(d)CMP kinase [Dermatophilaceae bacterium]